MTTWRARAFGEVRLSLKTVPRLSLAVALVGTFFSGALILALAAGLGV